MSEISGGYGFHGWGIFPWGLNLPQDPDGRRTPTSVRRGSSRVDFRLRNPSSPDVVFVIGERDVGEITRWRNHQIPLWWPPSGCRSTLSDPDTLMTLRTHLSHVVQISHSETRGAVRHFGFSSSWQSARKSSFSCLTSGYQSHGFCGRIWQNISRSDGKIYCM